VNPSRFVFVCFFLVPAIVLSLSAETVLRETGRVKNAVFYEAGSGEHFHRVLIVSPASSPVRRVVVVFPGYHPEGDPYLQSLENFLERWDLSRRAEETGSVFLVCDMGDSLYLSVKNGLKPDDLDFIEGVLGTEALRRYKGKVFVFLAVSTGVEGAIKFLSRHPRPGPAVLVALSGTYDLSLLPASSGEYLLHRRVFGDSPEIWKRESPVEALRSAAIAASSRHGALTVHVFSEEKSIFRAQLVRLSKFTCPGLTIVSYPEFGRGLGHGWGFWAEKGLADKVFSIISGVR